MNIKQYKDRFRKQKTSTLVKGYSGYNEEYRRYAREEFDRRKVPAKELPYTRRKKTQTSNIFGITPNQNPFISPRYKRRNLFGFRY